MSEEVKPIDAPKEILTAQEQIAAKAAAETAAESKTSEAVDESATETTEDSEATDENELEEKTETEDDESTEESEEKPEPKKNKSGIQKRFGKLTKRAALAEQERDYWRDQALNSQKPAVDDSKKSSDQKAAPGEPNPDDFEHHKDFVKAMVKWDGDQREAKAQAAKASETISQKQSSLTEKIKDFAKAHDDFDELVESVDHIPHSLIVRQAILDSDIGPELMYELAKNPAEYARIAGLDAISQARELGKFEAKIVLSKPLSTSTEKPEQKTTKAPKPVSPINSKALGAKKSIYDKNLSQKEFERLREEQTSRR